MKTESSRPRLRGCGKLEIGSWKLTEIKLAKYELRHQETQRASRVNERNLREHCWLAVKNAAN